MTTRVRNLLGLVGGGALVTLGDGAVWNGVD